MPWTLSLPVLSTRKTEREKVKERVRERKTCLSLSLNDSRIRVTVSLLVRTYRRTRNVPLSISFIKGLLKRRERESRQARERKRILRWQRSISLCLSLSYRVSDRLLSLPLLLLLSRRKR
jgi:hypothetical protein